MKHQWKTIDGEKWYKFDKGFDRFKYHYGHLVGIILSIAVIISVILMGFYIYENKIAFFDNPVAYGLKQIGEQNDGNAFCHCWISQFKGHIKHFKINESGFVVEKRMIRERITLPEFDTSAFENMTRS